MLHTKGMAGNSRLRRADRPAAFLRLALPRLRGSIDPGAVSAIAAAIQQQEGYAPGTLAYQNNNPGNLVYAGQPGAVPGAGGFAAFPTYAAGEQALENQITLDAVRGTDVNGNPTTTLAELIASWAPASVGNNPAAYTSAVAAQTGFDPNAPLSTLGVSSSGSGATYTLDLSSIGISSPVPVYYLLAAGIVVAIALNN
jgi:hypothetical protein